MFELRFPENSIEQWASANPEDLSALVQIGNDAQRRRYLTRPEFLEICAVKSPRTKSRCAKNGADFIREITEVSLTTSHEQLRIQVLTLLHGVAWPTVSFILHFCINDLYPVLDFRALWSLNVNTPPVYDFPFWWEYTKHCRLLAKRNRVSMRNLDRALWQYSREKQRT